MDKSNLPIKDVRLAIDEADKILLKALGARFRAIKYLGQLKKVEKKPVEDSSRERELKTIWKKQAKDLELNEEFVLLILDFILAESRRIQNEV
jgi:chorismate mutase